MSVTIDSVSSASGFKQKVTEAPASITIITSEDIQRYGYRTLADILRNVPGFYFSYDRNYSYLGVRGFGLPGQYNNSVALLVDGHRLNDNIYDGNLLGTDFPVDVDLIDRVEVIRGPNSSLYVASAFLGVVNVITKHGQDVPKLSAAGAEASYGTYQGRFTYGNKFFNGLEVLLSGSVYDSRGQRRLFFPEFNNPATNNGVATNADDDESHQLFANLSWGGFKLQGVFGSRDKGIPSEASLMSPIPELSTSAATSIWVMNARLAMDGTLPAGRTWMFSITMAPMFTIIPRSADLPACSTKISHTANGGVKT